MSWHCSRALEAEFSAESCSGGVLSAPSKLTTTAAESSRSGRTTESCSRSPSGTTFEPLMDDRGEALLTWFLAGFPARTSVPPGKGLASPESGPGSGRKCRGSLAKYDHDSRSWKTRQGSLLGGLIEFSETFPSWGMTRGGVLFRLPTPSGLLALRRSITSVSASGSLRLPTPGAAKANNDIGLTCSGDGREKPNKLGWAIAELETQRLTTPCADDTGLRKDRYAQGGAPLSLQVQRLATPKATDGSNGGPNQRDGAGNYYLPAQVVRLPTCHGFSKDGKSNGPSGNELGRAINRLPTPTVQDSANCGAPSQAERNSPPPELGSWWESEPGVGRVVHGLANRVDRLAAIGNGQVPAVVALAWRLLNDPEERPVKPALRTTDN